MSKLFLLASFLQERPKSIETHQDLKEFTSSIDFLQDSSKIQFLVSVSSPIFNIYLVLAKIFKIWFLEFFLDSQYRNVSKLFGWSKRFSTMLAVFPLQLGLHNINLKSLSLILITNAADYLWKYHENKWN